MPSPNFLLLTTRLNDALVDLLHETIPRAVSRPTDEQYTGSIEVGMQDRRSQRGWVVLEGAGGALQPETHACREVVLEFCGWSYVEREEGCIVLNTAARYACLTRSFLTHEPSASFVRTTTRHHARDRCRRKSAHRNTHGES